MMTESLPEMPRKYLDLKAPRSYMKVHTSGEVQRFFATANTDPMSMAQPWGDAFEPEYFPLVSTGVGSEEDGVFGAIYVELVLNVAVAKSGNVAKNCLLGGFGNIYITATFDCTFNSNYPPGALVKENVAYSPPREWHSFPRRKPGVPIPPELYPLIAKELAIHKHLRLNRLTNAFDRVCLWVLKEARKLLRPQQVAKMYQIMVGMFLGFTHPHVEVFRIPEGRKFGEDPNSNMPILSVRSVEAFRVICEGLNALMKDSWPRSCAAEVPDLITGSQLRNTFAAPVDHDTFVDPTITLAEETYHIGKALLCGLPPEEAQAVYRAQRSTTAIGTHDALLSWFWKLNPPHFGPPVPLSALSPGQRPHPSGLNRPGPAAPPRKAVMNAKDESLVRYAMREGLSRTVKAASAGLAAVGAGLNAVADAVDPVQKLGTFDPVAEASQQAQAKPTRADRQQAEAEAARWAAKRRQAEVEAARKEAEAARWEAKERRAEAMAAFKERQAEELRAKVKGMEEEMAELQKVSDAADAEAERQRAQDRAIFYHWAKNTKPVFQGWAELTEPQRAARREAEAKVARQKEAAEARARAAQRKEEEKAKEAARKAEIERELAVPLSAAEIEAREKEAERRRIAEAERERKEADKSNTLACDLKARPQHGPKEGILRKPTFATEHERIAHEDFISPAQREARREEGRAKNAEKKRIADNKRAEEARKREEERAWRSGGSLEPAPMGSLADWTGPKVALNGEDDGHSVRSLATTCVPLNPIDHAVQRGVLRHADRREAQWTRKHGTREPGHDGRVVFRGRPNGVDLVIDPATDAIITVYPARAKK